MDNSLRRGLKARRPFVLLVAELCFAFASGSAFGAGPVNPFQVGAWHAGAYTNDQTGLFSHCSAGVTYASHITMFVAVNRAMSWSLGFTHPQWSLSQGDRIPVQLRFDGGAPHNETGVVLLQSPPLVQVPMPVDSQLIKSFRAATQMTALARGQTFGFRLDGTSQLLPALVNCVNMALSAEANKPGAAPNTSGADNTLQELQLATNFLLAARLSNARVVSPSEVPPQLASIGTVWKSDNAAGAVKIYVPNPNQTGLDVASELISNDAKSCQGKFASARRSELVDADVVFRADTSCGDSQGERTLKYFIIPWHKSNFAIFVVGVTDTSQEQDAPASQTKEDMFKRAALGASR
jgi:hypothetical protein